jgi:hypothetical protein
LVVVVLVDPQLHTVGGQKVVILCLTPLRQLVAAAVADMLLLGQPEVQEEAVLAETWLADLQLDMLELLDRVIQAAIQ